MFDHSHVAYTGARGSISVIYQWIMHRAVRSSVPRGRRPTKCVIYTSIYTEPFGKLNLCFIRNSNIIFPALLDGRWTRLQNNNWGGKKINLVLRLHDQILAQLLDCCTIDSRLRISCLKPQLVFVLFRTKNVKIFSPIKDFVWLRL